MHELPTISLTQKERENQAISKEKIARAVQCVENHGMVVIQGAVEKKHVLEVYQQMLSEHEDFLKRFPGYPLRGPGGFGAEAFKGLPPPRAREFLFEDIIFNPYAIAVTESILGRGVHCGSYNSHWVFSSGPDGQRVRQSVHADCGSLFSNEGGMYPLSPALLTVNVPLVDFTEANGATELWLGTHKAVPSIFDLREYDEIKGIVLKRMETNPPIRLLVPTGSLIVRDPRMWHAAFPNLTNEPRVMLTMKHCRNWYRDLAPPDADGEQKQSVIAFERSAREFLYYRTRLPLKIRCRFVDPPCRDHIWEALSRYWDGTPL